MFGITLLICHIEIISTQVNEGLIISLSKAREVNS